MASRLVRDASGGFSFFGKMQKSDLKKFWKLKFCRMRRMPRKQKCTLIRGKIRKRVHQLWVNASAVEVHLGLKSGCYAQSG